MSVTCAVCGRSVDPDSEYAEIEVLQKRRRDRDELDEFFMHERCAANVLGSWERP